MVLTSTLIGYRSRWSPLELTDRTIDDPIRPSEIVVKVSYMALNPIDIKLRHLWALPIPYAVGKEFSGTVAKVGAAVQSQYKVGDRVCGGLFTPFQGYVGTYARLDARKNQLLKLGNHLTDAEAAAFPMTFGTAWSMINTGKVAPNARVLVLGGSTTVGSYVIQLLKQEYQASEVVATCSAASSQRVLQLGADKTVDYREGNLSEKLKALGVKFDAVLDTVGGYDALRVWPQILKPARDGGSYVTIAGDAPPSSTYAKSMIPPMFNAPWIVGRLLFGRFLGIDYHVVTMGSPDWIPTAQKLLLSDKKKGAKRLTIPIDSVWPLADYQKAWDKLDRIGNSGKVLIKMSND